MSRAASLGAMLLALWLLLSGHYGALPIALGVASVICSVVVARRMGLVDGGTPLIRLGWRLSRYWLWLLAQIVRANVAVARAILDPRLKIGPTLVRVRPSQRSDLGRVIYANSITLTPGTVTLGLEPEELFVHALTAEAAADLVRGEMDRRVSRLEGEGA